MLIAAFLLGELEGERLGETERAIREERSARELHGELRETAAFVERLFRESAPEGARESAPRAPRRPVAVAGRRRGAAEAARAARRLSYPMMAFAAVGVAMLAYATSTFSEKLRGAGIVPLGGPVRIAMEDAGALGKRGAAFDLAQAKIEMKEGAGAPAPSAAPAPPTAPAPHEQVYRLLILKGASEREARDFKIVLESMGYLPVYIVREGNAWRVYYGNFANRNDALKMKARLERDGFSVLEVAKTARQLVAAAPEPANRAAAEAPQASASLKREILNQIAASPRTASAPKPGGVKRAPGIAGQSRSASEQQRAVDALIDAKLKAAGSSGGGGNQALVNQIVDLEKKLNAMGADVQGINKSIDRFTADHELEARNRVTIAQKFRAADTLAKSGKTPEAIASIREILAMEPENAIALNRLRMLESMGQGESYQGEKAEQNKTYEQRKAMAQQEESRGTMASLIQAKSLWQQSATIHERYAPEAEARIAALDAKIKIAEAQKRDESSGFLDGLARIGRSIFGGENPPPPPPPVQVVSAATPVPTCSPFPSYSPMPTRTPDATNQAISELLFQADQRGSHGDFDTAVRLAEAALRLDPNDARAISRRRFYQEQAAARAAAPTPLPPPPADMFFDDHGVNPFVDVNFDNLSTFSIDVDTASYTMARDYLNRGTIPPPASIRVEEIINYFPDNYAPPASEAFAVYGSMAPSPFGPGLHLLRVGIKGREIAPTERKPLVLTFVIDVSGSMSQGDRLGLVKRTLRRLVAHMRPEDRIGIAKFDTTASVVLPHIAVGNGLGIEATLEALQPGGSTNAGDGLNVGYEMARGAFDVGAVNRVILCSDGVANTGVTDPQGIRALVAQSAGANIYLTTVGVGMGNYNDSLMEELADNGNGHYSYINNDEEARSFIEGRLIGSMEVVAQDVKIQAAFNRAAVARYRLIGFEDRDVADADFRNDAVDAGEIGSGHSVTALYELELRPGAREEVVADVSIRFKQPDFGMAAREIKGALRKGEILSTVEGADDHFKLVACAAEYAEILRNSHYAWGCGMREVASRFDASFPSGPPSAEAAELRRLIDAADAPTRSRPRPPAPLESPRPMQMSGGPAPIRMD